MKKFYVIFITVLMLFMAPVQGQAQLNHPPEPDWVFDHSDFSHRVGHSFFDVLGRWVYTGWETTNGERGLLQEGPNIILPPGKKMLKYQLDGDIVQGKEIFIDVLSWNPRTYSYKVPARRIIRTLPVSRNYLYEDKFLCFDIDSDHEYLQFRVGSWGSNLRIYDDIGVYEGYVVGNQSEEPGIVYQYNATELYHRVGARHPTGGWYASDTTPSGWLAFGPYVPLDTLGGEQFVAAFELTAKRYAGHPNDLVAYVDVCTEYGRNVLANLYVYRHDFAVNMQKQTFTLEFPAPGFEGYENLEMRVFHYDRPDSFLKLDDVYIFSTGPVPVGVR